jgi:peptidoglycan/LPS O-acetylase OafA/YrhL
MTHHKHPPHLTHPKYRPDIDGLRAIAILAVVIFHAFPNKMPGGFIGVDIFFVISGYLISTIIFSSLERDRFSFVEFYVRRIRRIFPALVLVLASCFTFGWFVLFAGEYQQLGKHTVASAGFIQNFALLLESGYFDNSAETKPLLHLWSLAIEEQFYIFWPVLLVFVRQRQWSFLRLTAVIAVISFAENIYLIMSGHLTEAFYLPASRFWELMVGGVLAYLVLHRPQLIDKYKDAQSIFGAALIFAGLFLLNKGRDFPGWWALLPTMGTFFIISAGPGARLNEKLLANRPMVWIGLISYPLYLWHWPILAYLKILLPESSELLKLGALALAVLLAWLTYLYIELKLRNFGNRAITPLVLLMIMIAAIGMSIYPSGFPRRDVNKPLMNLEPGIFKQSRRSDGSCQKLLELKKVKEEVCLTNSPEPSVLFVGDSHAMALFSAIYAGRFPAKGLLISSHGCPTYPGLQYTPAFTKPWGNYCTEIALEGLTASRTISSIDTVVIVNKGPREIERELTFRDSRRSYNEKEAFIPGNEYLIRALLNDGKKVIFVADTPKLKRNALDCVNRGLFAPRRDCAPSRMEHDELHRNYWASLRIIQKHFPELIVFDPAQMFCDNARCQFQDASGAILYNDSHHISIEASGQLLEMILHDE